MPKSRYTDTAVVDKHHYVTWSLPVKSLGLVERDLVTGIQMIDHVIQRGERIDHLAAKYLGEEQYWWVIALVNKISYPFKSGGFTPGRLLKIPVNVKDVFDRIFGG
jgi:hypothetical protein